VYLLGVTASQAGAGAAGEVESKTAEHIQLPAASAACVDGRTMAQGYGGTGVP